MLTLNRWVFTAWVFCLAACVNIFGLFIEEDRKQLKFSNVAWSLIFPVTGFALATVSEAQSKKIVCMTQKWSLMLNLHLFLPCYV